MPAFKRISVDGPNFYEHILLPSFGDTITDSDVRSGFFGEFMIMDDVADSRKIIELSRVRNILKRRDASCKIVFQPVGKADVRRISVTDLYAATEHCAQEFYQGCLKDWRNGDPIFRDKIFKFFRQAIREDLISNLYFGDTSRAENSDQTAWSANRFDGIYTQYAKYIADGRLPAGQTFNVANAEMTATQAKDNLQSMFKKQDEYMKMLPNGEKAFYIDQQWAEAYEDYLIATGATNGQAVNYVQDGINVRAYKGIPIFVNPIFSSILTQIAAPDAHLGILTLRGNFIFATDSSYGEGPNLNQALIIFYDWTELQWKWLNFLKVGTGIALPEHTVLALPT